MDDFTGMAWDDLHRWRLEGDVMLYLYMGSGMMEKHSAVADTRQVKKLRARMQVY